MSHKRTCFGRGDGPVEQTRARRTANGGVQLAMRPCGATHTELHVLEFCPMSRGIRDSSACDASDQLMAKASNTVCQVIDKVPHTYT